MGRIAIPNLEAIRAENPRFAEALDYISQCFGNVQTQTGADPTQQQSAPPPQIQAFTVTASGGIFDLKITDSSPISRHINYFAEYSADSGFNKPTPVDMGATRNLRVQLGNQTFYWRAFSAYRSSGPSTPIYHGGQTAAPVSGGGATLGPVPSDSSGSGTASTDGTQGGAGFGIIPQRKG